MENSEAKIKIFSKFRDYYDSVQIFGQDDIKFIRYTKKVEDIPVNFREVSPHNKSHYTWDNIKIGFCGKLYTGYKFVGPKVETKFLYTLKEIENFYKDMNWDFEKKTGTYNKNMYTDFLKVEEQNKTGFYNKFFEKYLTPIFVCAECYIDRSKGRVDSEYYGFKQVDICEINGKLSDYNFQTVFDVPSAFQEIRMYLSNMAFPNKDIPIVSDEDLIIAKGFDPRFSFRKDPSNDKRK